MAQATLHKILQGHTSIVNSVAFSPDSKLIASASDDKIVRLWNVPNGDLNSELNGHEHDVRSIVFSPDGKSIVTGGGPVRTWSVATKQQVKIFNGHSKTVNSVTWSPNGAFIASGSYDTSVILWDAISGSMKKTLKGHTSSVWSVSFSQNNNKLASAGYDETVIIWDVNSGAALIKLTHAFAVYSVCFSRDDQFVVTGGADKILRMFNVDTGREEKRFEGHTDSIWSAVISFDGSTIASGSLDKSVRLWDVASTKQLQQLNGHTNDIFSVAFSRDGKFIASGSEDKTARLWNAPSSLQRQSLPKPVSPEMNKSETETQQKQATLDPTQVAEWSVDDVCSYLKQAKIDDDVIAIFRKQKIKGKSLASKVKDEVLKSIGIEAMGDREDVIDAINELLSPATSTPSTTSGNSFIIQRHELNIRDVTLGSGHFGKVMLAEYKGMPVALKQSKVSDVDKYQEFVNEALTMKRLPPHNFVVNCVGLCMTDNEAYVVLELCKGSLLDRLRDTSQPPFGPKQRLEILYKMAQGMNHLCQHQILHGDFACRNVLYQLTGGQILLKVSDFGGARKLTGDKTYYSVRGKDIAFAWTAPEVFSSHHCDHQSDVFSFGVAMWEVYTNGAEPHADKQPLMIPGFVTTPSNYPLLPKPPQCPNDVYDLINRCMVLEPKYRPTFAQIVAQLSQMLTNI